MKTETDKQKEIMLAAQDMGGLAFRNNVGGYKVGNQFVRYGLCPSSSDIISCTPVTITPEMVGQTIGVFTAIEVKRDEKELVAWWRARSEHATRQRAFMDAINGKGGVAFVSCNAGDISEQFSATLQLRFHQTVAEASQTEA